MPFVAKLPARKSDNPKHGCRVARWDDATGSLPDRHGTLEVYTPGKPTDRFAVTEFDHDLAGRGFRCVKVTGGTDAEEDAYDVLLGDSPQHDDCGCKGFVRWGNCKHIDGLRAVIAEGAMARDAANSDADCGPTEPDAAFDLWADEYEMKLASGWAY